MVLEKTLESALGCKEIQPVHPKGDQSWVFIGRSDIEAENPILWPPDVKSWLIWKDPDAGKDWGQEEKGTTEDEMVWWHHRLNGHEFGWAPGVDVGQGYLACCSSWGCKELDTTEWLNWTELIESIEKQVRHAKEFLGGFLECRNKCRIWSEMCFWLSGRKFLAHQSDNGHRSYGNNHVEPVWWQVLP